MAAKPPWLRDVPAARRGQSSVIGVVLVLAVTLLGVTGVMLYGASALSEAHTKSEIDAAEHAMTQLDSRFSLTALGSSERQSASVNLRGGTPLTVDGTAGWMNVSVVNRDAGNFTVLNATLGAVRYENSGTTIAYQGGGVWKRTDGGGSAMVSPPEFHYRTTAGEDPTLTLPIVLVRGSGSLGERVGVAKNTTVSRYPRDGSPDLANPLQSGEITVTVKSDYYEAWGTFFEERTGGTVAYDHGRKQVTITLVVTPDEGSVTQAVASTSAGELSIKGGGGSDSFTDSYDSSDGTGYPGTVTTPYEGTIVTQGSVSLSGGADIYGNLQTGGGYIDLGGNTRVHGDVYHGGSPPDCPGNDCSTEITGAIVANGTAPSFSPLTDLDNRIDDLRETNDNAGTGSIDEATNEWNDSASLTLTQGSYYVDDQLDSGQSLVLDTSGGDIILAIDGDVAWDGNQIDVPNTGNGVVRVYVGGSAFTVEGGAKVGDLTDHNSTALQVYSEPGLDVELRGSGTELVGIIYAPGTAPNPGSVELRSHAQLYGGVVGGTTTIRSGASIHFDQALTGTDLTAVTGTGAPTVTYLHVTENWVNVSSR